MLAPVQHPRLEQQHRRHRADGVHPARPAAGDRRREGVRRGARRRASRAGRGGGGDGPRTAARNRLRGAAGRLAAGPDAIRSARSSARSCASIGCAPESPAETYSTPRRLTVRIVAHSRAAERSRGARERSAGVGRFKPDGTPTPAAAGFAAKQRRRRRRARARAHAEGRVPGVPQAAARQGDGRRAAGRARRHAARPVVPEGDALGRDARGRPGRSAVRPSDPLDAVSLRRPRRAVHDRAHAGGADLAGAGRVDRRRHLRPSLPDDERPRRPRDQGALVRRVSRAAARELRHPRAQRAPQQDRPRARRQGAAAAGARQPRRSITSPACCTRCRIWSSIRRSSPARSRSSSSSCRRKC